MTTRHAPPAPAAPSRPTVHAERGVAVVALGGRLDRRAMVGILQAVAEAVRRGPEGVVADLSGADLGQDGLVVLTVMRRRVARAGRRFALAGATPDVALLLEGARVSALYRSHPSVGDALGVIRPT